MILLPEAAICGRFQPLHNEHLDYILSAKRLSHILWIGLVSPTPGVVSPEYRLASTANPLTYSERVEMILEALSDEGVSREMLKIVPFDLVDTASIPSSVQMLITKCDEWGDTKEAILRKNYSVHVLTHRTIARITGSAVRQMIASGDSSWKSLVPKATIRLAARLDLRSRLQSLVQSQTQG